MNQRDWELLDKQLYGFSSRPPQNSGAVGLVVVAILTPQTSSQTVMSEPRSRENDKTSK